MTANRALEVPSPDGDQLPSSMLLLTPQATALYVNDAFCRATGMTREDALGEGWWAALDAPSKQQVIEAAGRRQDFSIQLRMTAWQRDVGGASDAAPGWADCDARWLDLAGHHVCVLHDVTAGKLAELSAHAKAAQLRLLADNVPALIAYYEAGTFQCLFANKQYAQSFGFNERSVIGKTVGEVVGEEAARQIQPHIDRILRTRQPVSYERHFRHADGTSRWMEVNLLPQLNADGAIIAAFVLISDITKHRHAELAARESEARLSKFMQASVEGIAFLRDGLIIDANPPLCELLGYSLDEVLGRRSLDFVAPDQVARVAAFIAARQESTYESVLMHKDGTRIPVEIIPRTLTRDGEQLRMSIVRDIRDRQAAQARIHYLAHHDPLTGLPNRAAFIERMQSLSESVWESGARLALLFIDLDHFKRVNDSLGHLAGDRLLQTVANRIAACVRSTDLVARFGGDEFLVLLTGAQGRAEVEEVAGKLLAAIEQPIDVDGRYISVSPSVGIALRPEHGEAPAELIKHADAAMYLAKARGRANYQFFDPHMANVAYSALVMEGELGQAIERGEFTLCFQPQVSARDGSLVGTEALIRWSHPIRGMLLPDEFIPVAEQRRLMLPIGRWVLREALRCAGRWQSTALAGTPVAVNLTSMQFHASGFVELIVDVLRESGLPGHLLELELTERMLMSDLSMVKSTLHELKRLGLRISVDDFGTGYSSLGHLKELPIDKMKIDRSFVRDLPGERDSAAIASAIIQMGRSLGITVIAEGVETEAQREFLAREHCDELQGNLIGVPMDFELLLEWAKRLNQNVPA
jgi:diguanylate cyclase (GGDEF)-like protein/PAS domain S-box-containing protein